MDRTRRGGSGAQWSGDACVALGGGAMRSWDEGDASVPSPHNPSPAPTGTKGLPRGGHTKPPLVVVRVPLCPCLCATYETNETSETSETNSKQNLFQRTYP